MDQKKKIQEEDAAAEKLRISKLEDFRAGIRFNLEHKEGRAFLWGILERAAVFNRPYQPDEAKNRYREGQTAEGLNLYREIMTINPKAMEKIWAENNKGAN